MVLLAGIERPVLIVDTVAGTVVVAYTVVALANLVAFHNYHRT